MNGHAVYLRSRSARQRASDLIWNAPAGSFLEISPPTRTLPQNKIMWVYLSKISMAKPGGRIATPDVWKAVFLHACNHAVQFENGLDGSPFPIGFRSSKLSKSQMADLITFIQAWAAENRVPLGDEEEAA